MQEIIDNINSAIEDAIKNVQAKKEYTSTEESVKRCLNECLEDFKLFNDTVHVIAKEYVEDFKDYAIGYVTTHLKSRGIDYIDE